MLLKKTRLSNPLSYCWSWLNQPLALNLSITPHCHLIMIRCLTMTHRPRFRPQFCLLLNLNPARHPPDPSQISYLQFPESCFPTSAPALWHTLFLLPKTSSLSLLIHATQNQSSNLMSLPPGSLPWLFLLPATGRIDSSMLPSSITSHPLRHWWLYYKYLFISLSLSADLNSLSTSLRIWHILSPQ